MSFSFGSFFSSIGHFFQKITGSAPSWQKQASLTVSLAAPLIGTIVAETATEADAVEVGKVATEVQNDLTLVGNLLKQASQPGANVTTEIVTVLNTVKGNLGSILTAGHIKNADTLTKVTAIVNTVIGEVEAILSALPQTNG